MDLRLAFSEFAGRAARLASRRAIVVIVACGVVAVAGALLAVKLSPQTGVETLTGSSSKTYKETQAFDKQFGADPVVILIRGSLQKLMLSSDIGAIAGLEGCVSGNIPAAAMKSPSTPAACKAMAVKKYAQVVYGPGTFVTTAADSLNSQLDAQFRTMGRKADKVAEAARKVAAARGYGPAQQEQLANQAKEVAGLTAAQQLVKLSTKYGIGFANRPAINNSEFVSQLVFDGTRGYDVPKSRFAYLFPNKNSAIIQVRLRPGLSSAQRGQAISLIRAAAEDERYHLANGTYTVTGAPVLLSGVEHAIKHAAIVLLIAAFILMAIALLIVFPAELRLLPLMLALMAAAVTFGLLSISGAALGVGAIAVLPVLIGIAVDYAIQFQYRIERERLDSGHDGAVERGARGVGAPVVTAALATIAALIALVLSPIPLVRGFGALLAAGVAIALLLVLTMGFAVLAWAGSDTPSSTRNPARSVAGVLRYREVSGWLQQHGRRALTVALALALIGWVAGAFGPVKTDINDLASGNVQAVKDVKTLQKVTGTAGDVEVLVRAQDITDPKVLAWMRKYQQQVLADAGYKGERPDCTKAKLCPALSLTDLFAGHTFTQSGVRQVLRTVPYYAQAMVSEDRTLANIAFRMRLQSLTSQEKLIQSMRSHLHPPAGVQANVVGLTALGADATGRLASPGRRLLVPGAALVLVLLVMAAVLRSWRRALPPVIAVLIAGGLSALLLFATRIPLNPLSAALNVFVIAITTEFSALVYMQYLREREHAETEGVIANYRRALRKIGPALFASGVTALVGFGTLAASSISLLRGFGLVAVVDLGAALVGALLILPIAIEWTEQRWAAKRSSVAKPSPAATVSGVPEGA